MLFKNVRRTLNKQKFQLLLLGFIIVLSSFIYTTMDYGVGGILTPTMEYFDQANQEDFAISMTDYLISSDVAYMTDHCAITEPVYTLSGLKTIDESCYYSVMDYRLNTIRNTYPDINIELREYKDMYYDFDNSVHRMRILKDMSQIDKSYIVAGEKPSSDNEIAVSEAYAKNNDLTIGDSITVGNQDYTISGYVLFPDYSLAIFGQQFIFDNQSQTLGLVTDNQFEHLSEMVGFEIGGTFKDGMDASTFKSDVIEQYRDNTNLSFVTNMVLTENNIRSGAIYGDIEGGQAMGLGLSLIIASIALLIVSIMVSKVLQSQRGPIGILKSLGYKNSEITKPYIFFIAIMSFPSIVLGYFLGVWMSEPLKNMYLKFYLLPSKPIYQTWGTFFIAVLVPFMFLLILSYVIIRRILSQKPVTLLNPQVTSSSNFLTKYSGKLLGKLNIIEKLKHLLLYRNIVKFIAFIIGMFYAGFLIMMSLSMIGMFDRMSVDYYQQTDYNYIGYCDYQSGCPPITKDEEKVIELPSVILDDEDVYLVGLSPDNELHHLFDKKGNNIAPNLRDGMIISKSLSLSKGFKVGDQLELDIGADKYNVTVTDISDEYSGDKAYMDITELSNMISNTDNYYNTIYSKDPLSDNDFAVVVSVDDILQQTQTMQQLMNFVIWILMAVSIIIGAVIVYILTVMTIEDNFYNISLFKVIGYNKKEINKIILGGYLMYGISIFVIAYPIAYISFKILVQFMAQYYNIVIPFDLKLWHGAVSIVMFIIIFYLGAYVARKKLEKVSLQEAMKMYQV